MKPNRRDFDRRLYKKCIKCRNFKPRENIEQEDGTILKKGFGSHNSSDGLQSICFTCKNVANTKARERNVTARIRHHTATRCTTQLGDAAPEGFVQDLEKYLGYKIKRLVRHLSQDLKDREGPKRKLRDALNEGWYIDHIKPLMLFKVIETDEAGVESINWDVFRECWDIKNLSAIPATENLAKGAKYSEVSSDEPTSN